MKEDFGFFIKSDVEKPALFLIGLRDYTLK